jgi:hypothetical protein
MHDNNEDIVQEIEEWSKEMIHEREKKYEGGDWELKVEYVEAFKDEQKDAMP